MLAFSFRFGSSVRGWLLALPKGGAFAFVMHQIGAALHYFCASKLRVRMPKIDQGSRK
jgi:hypothetical protein